MTSSYQIARRPPRRYTDFSSYAINGGICPEGFDTYFYGKHDWRICVPNPHPSTSLNNCRGPSSEASNTSEASEASKREDYTCCGRKTCSNNPQTKPTCIEEGCGNWQNGSSNEWAKGCPTPKSGWRTSRATLYDDRDPAEGWLYNTIPYQIRRQLHTPRAEYDRYDYFQLPTRYDGTGYQVLRGWKRPQYAEDMVDVPPVWDETRLFSAQPYPIQQEAKRSLEEGWSTLTTREDGGTGINGAFYGTPVKEKGIGNTSQYLWDYNQTGSVQPINT